MSNCHHVLAKFFGRTDYWLLDLPNYSSSRGL
jgi:hypothetical protein